MTPPDATAGTRSDDLSGRLLAGRYRLNRPIAAGGMAAVWEATDQLLSRRVAVKVLHRHLAGDASFVKRFRAEAIAAARLTHPCIVSVYDTVTEDGIDAIVMELVTGRTLRAELDEFGTLGIDAAIAVGAQVADALGAAHATGLVHRDVKPANILLSADGRVLVADFGIAKAAQGTDLTEAGSFVGTAKYLAPEQVEGSPVDGRADLFALGVVLYEALTGRPPFVADNDAATAFARLHQTAVAPREHRPEIPPALESVVLTALARKPGDRFQDAASMRLALLRSNDTSPAGTTPSAVAPPRPAPPAPPARPAPQPPPPPPPPTRHGAPTAKRSNRRILGVVAVIAVIALGALAVALNHRGGEVDLPVARLASFDPYGDNRAEKDELLPRLTDGDADSAWRTEVYPSPDFRSGGSTKPGVGIVIVLERVSTLRRLVLETPVGGWSMQVHVASRLPSDGSTPVDLAGWGPTVATVDDAPTGTVNVPVGSVKGQAVLVWFTRAADFHGLYAVQISDVEVRGS